MQILAAYHYLRIRNACYLFFLGIVAVGMYANIRCWQAPSDLIGYDINYIFIEGQRVTAGVNPYSRILSGDMANNQKYATYFPAYYELSALTQILGLRDFESWLSAWRWTFIIFNIGIASVLFLALGPASRPWLALAAAGYWLLNRWTFEETFIAHLDFPAIFFLVLSLSEFQRMPHRAAYYLGISLALKQIAIFIVPLYLILVWTGPSRISSNRVRELVGTAIRIAVIPAIVSLPFLLWNPEGFVRSIFFSFTRNPSNDIVVQGGAFGLPSAGELLAFHLPIEHLALNRQLLRVPMLILLGLTYVAALRREIGLHLGTLLVIAIFVDYNPVFFSYYMVWIVPLIPLIARDFAAWRPYHPA